jgi:hypothetical protein
VVRKYVCIPRSFLVVNICNQEKTLCSPCTFANVEKALFICTFRIHRFGLEYQKGRARRTKWRILEFWNYVYILRNRLTQLLKIPFRYKWTSGVEHTITIPTFSLRKFAVGRHSHPDNLMPTQYFTMTLSFKSSTNPSENFVLFR